MLIEGFRPGVMEKLGIGPSNCHDKLIYGRMTGWGQVGKFSKTAGHDINYLGITGALHAIGNDERPIPPLNLVADYGGGSMFLIFGILFFWKISPEYPVITLIFLIHSGLAHFSHNCSLVIS